MQPLLGGHGIKLGVPHRVVRTATLAARSLVQGLWFMVYGLWFMVYDLGCGGWGLGSGVALSLARSRTATPAAQSLPGGFVVGAVGLWFVDLLLEPLVYGIWFGVWGLVAQVRAQPHQQLASCRQTMPWVYNSSLTVLG